MNLSHSVHPIRQPHVYDCWAAATAMVLRRRGLEGVNYVKERARSAGLDPNRTMTSSGVPMLARAVHRHCKNLTSPPAPVSVADLTRALRNSCAAAFGHYNYEGCPTSEMHVLLFYRLAGNDANPTVYLVDPYTAERTSYLATDINEALGAVDFLLYE